MYQYRIQVLEPGSYSLALGLKTGDRLVAIEGKVFTTPACLQTTLPETGCPFTLTYTRGENAFDVTCYKQLSGISAEEEHYVAGSQVLPESTRLIELSCQSADKPDLKARAFKVIAWAVLLVFGVPGFVLLSQSLAIGGEQRVVDYTSLLTGAVSLILGVGYFVLSDKWSSTNRPTRARVPGQVKSVC